MKEKPPMRAALQYSQVSTGQVCCACYIEMINNKARHNLINAKCRWRSDWLDGVGSFREPLSQTKVMQIRQGETLSHQGTITHEVCYLAAQFRTIEQVLYLKPAIKK